MNRRCAFSVGRGRKRCAPQCGCRLVAEELARAEPRRVCERAHAELMGASGEVIMVRGQSDGCTVADADAGERAHEIRTPHPLQTDSVGCGFRDVEDRAERGREVTW